MPRHMPFPSQPANHPPLALRLAAIFLSAALLAACSLPGASPAASTRPASTATPKSLLDGETVYWSQGFALIALRASDGAVRWQVEGPTTPTLVDGMLYAATGLNPAGADAVDVGGAIRWQTPLTGCFNSIDMGAAPIVAGGLLYLAVSGHDCAPNGSVYALRASDGSIAWRALLEPQVLQTEAFSGNALLVTSTTYPATNEQDFLTALRPADGTRLWRVRLDLSPYFLAAEDGVVVISGFGQGGLTFEARRASDGQLLWSTSADRYNLAPPVIANGLVYVSGRDGSLGALRLADGSQQWSVATTAGSGAFAPSEPAVSESGIIYWGAGPVLYALDAATGAIHQIYHLFPDKQGAAPGVFGFFYSPPTYADGALFVAVNAVAQTCCSSGVGNATLYALDASTGVVLWQHHETTGRGNLPAVVGAVPAS